MIILNKILKLIVGFFCYVLLNNLIINLVTITLFQYSYFYFYGLNCKGEINYKGIIVACVFLAFKILILFLYQKRYNILYYYLIFDVLMSLVLTFDYLFGTLFFGYFYSNRPLINLSKFMFQNHILIILNSLLALTVIVLKNLNTKYTK